MLFCITRKRNEIGKFSAVELYSIAIKRKTTFQRDCGVDINDAICLRWGTPSFVICKLFVSYVVSVKKLLSKITDCKMWNKYNLFLFRKIFSVTILLILIKSSTFIGVFVVEEREYYFWQVASKPEGVNSLTSQLRVDKITFIFIFNIGQDSTDAPLQGSYTFWPMDFQDFSMTLNQMSTTKLKSR